ncbi:MAG: NADH-quinone oxidoreductase subunit NuoF [Candidatus Wallbacteria bacterium]|nr:NADH-quinone oxidoreductase subunit NuoF [Candidatus Wallbacteria bacterium]
MSGAGLTGLTAQKRIVLVNAGVINPESIASCTAAGGYQALRKALRELKPADVTEEVKKSGLRGRGGAGFPTGLKWSFTAPLDGEKYIVCNADEGEPGTFKDRLIMEGDPHKLVEGMTIAGYAIGAGSGFVYIRGEYGLSIRRMNQAVEDARREGFLGKNIMGSGFDFDICVRSGAGAYVCGEETSLINSLEGGRGYPRIKPPFPGVRGLWGRPTVVNNVETIANVPAIIENGAAWFRSFGTEKSSGTKIFCISGAVANPGSVEAGMGITLRELIYTHSGGMKDGAGFKAALIGGAAGCFVSGDMMDVRMDFEHLAECGAVLGSGAVMVISDRQNIGLVLKKVLEFFRHESCGQCMPCRIGCRMLNVLMDKCLQGKQAKENFGRMMELAEAMKDSSFCALGQSPVMPVKSAHRYFADEIASSEAGRRK